jgi:hypothetical protein
MTNKTMFEQIEFINPDRFLMTSMVFYIKFGLILSFIEVELFYKRNMLEYLRLLLACTLPIIKLDFIMLSVLLISDYLLVLLHFGIPVFKENLYEDINAAFALSNNKADCFIFYNKKEIFKVDKMSQNPNLYLPMIKEMIENPNLDKYKVDFINDKLKLIKR